MSTANEALSWGAAVAVTTVFFCRVHSPLLYITSLFCFYPILNKARQVLAIVDLPVLITPLTVCLLFGLSDATRGAVKLNRNNKHRLLLFLPLTSLLPILQFVNDDKWSGFVFCRGYFQFIEAFTVFLILYSILGNHKIQSSKIWTMWIASSCLFAIVELAVYFGTSALEILMSGGLRDGDKSAVSAGFYEILVFANILVFFVGYYWQTNYRLSVLCFFLVLLSQTRAAILYATALVIAISALSINKGAIKRIIIISIIAAPLLMTFALGRFSSQLTSGDIQLANGPSIGHSTAIKGLILIEASDRIFRNPLGDYAFQPEVDATQINDISLPQIIIAIILSPITNWAGYGLLTLVLILFIYLMTALHLKNNTTLLVSFIAFVYASAFTSNVAFWSNIELSTANSISLPHANNTSFDNDGKYYVHHNDGVFWIFTVIAICLTTRKSTRNPPSLCLNTQLSPL